MFQYDEDFYKLIEETEMDEKIIIPLIIQWLSPKSIVDFGCAEGAWLGEVLHQNSEISVLGLDGDYVNRKRLKIPEQNFQPVDLRQPISLDDKFELAISTEVAEHLEQEFVDIYIDNITKAADQILFSAAVPEQGGTHHVNEQWQSYWVEKFKNRGYYCDYSVRNYFWNEPRISSWRRQNLLFFSKVKKSIAPIKKLIDVIQPEEEIRRRKRSEKILIEGMRYYILNPEVYIKLDQMIAELINHNKKIVIYPYGKNGKLCEKILLWKYGVEDYIIADNKIDIKEKKIYKAESLKKMANRISVIDTCSNSCIHKEILEHIQEYVNTENIYSVFEVGE